MRSSTQELETSLNAGAIYSPPSDPQIIWPIANESGAWKEADGHYHRGSSGGGQWQFKSSLPERWTITYGELKFHIKPTSFKHTGLFPEQAVNWSWMMDKIRSAGRPPVY